METSFDEMSVEGEPFYEDKSGFNDEENLKGILLDNCCHLNMSEGTLNLNMASEESMDVTEDENVAKEFFEMEAFGEHNSKTDVELPTEFSSLIFGKIKNDALNKESSEELRAYQFKHQRPILRQKQIPSVQPKHIEKCRSEQKLDMIALKKNKYDEIGSVKRPSPLLNCRNHIKRFRFSGMENKADFCIKASFDLSDNKRNSQVSLYCKSISLNDADLMRGWTRLDNINEQEFIGDLSKPHLLPLFNGKHNDLKSISCDTLACLINDHYNAEIESYKIIDCRYPYEYDGGHIRGATNLYTQAQIIERLLKEKQSSNPYRTLDLKGKNNKRNILIFYCEFSTARAPKLLRYLRSSDRKQNSCSYPALNYPEIYLLHNGYKEFFKMYGHLCEPAAYRPMLDPSYNEAFRHFRAKSKSWNGVDGIGRDSCNDIGEKALTSRIKLDGTERRCLNYRL